MKKKGFLRPVVMTSLSAFPCRAIFIDGGAYGKKEHDTAEQSGQQEQQKGTVHRQPGVFRPADHEAGV